MIDAVLNLDAYTGRAAKEICANAARKDRGIQNLLGTGILVRAKKLLRDR